MPPFGDGFAGHHDELRIGGVLAIEFLHDFFFARGYDESSVLSLEPVRDWGLLRFGFRLFHCASPVPCFDLSCSGCRSGLADASSSRYGAMC